MTKLPRMPLALLLAIGLALTAGVVLLVAFAVMPPGGRFRFLAASILFNATVAILAMATLLAIAGSVPRRVCWVGFTLFAWTYAVCGIYLHKEGNRTASSLRMDTSLLPDVVASALVKPASDEGRAARTIVHAIVTLLVGVVGYVVAFRIATPRADDEDQEETEFVDGAASGSVAHGAEAAQSFGKSRGIPLSAFMCVFPLMAAGICALKYPSDLWSGCLLLLTLAVLAMATLNAIVSPRRDRECWGGFAAFGWISLMLSTYLLRDSSSSLLDPYSASFPAVFLSHLIRDARADSDMYARIILHTMVALFAGLIGYCAAHAMSNPSEPLRGRRPRPVA